MRDAQDCDSEVLHQSVTWPCGACQGTDRKQLAVPRASAHYVPWPLCGPLASDRPFTYAPGPGPMFCLSGPALEALDTSAALKLDSSTVYLITSKDSLFALHGSLPPF